MLPKNVAVTFSLTGDLHSYSDRRLNEMHRLFSVHQPDLNFSIGDFPHQFTQKEAQKFDYIDVAVPGNHEFYHTSDSLDEIKNKIPFISVSSFNAEYQDQLFPSYRTFNVKGKQISVIGLNIFPEVENKAKDKRYSIIPFSESLEKAAILTKFLKQKTDLFVYLSHCGIDFDVKILENMPRMAQIDLSKMLIFGGHNHVNNPKPGSILESRILHSGNNLDELGFADIGFMNDGSTTVLLSNIIVAKKHKAIFNNTYPVEIISNKYSLDFIDNDFFHVNSMGALFADKMRKDYKADIAIINAGSLRDTIQDRYNPENAYKIAKRIVPFAENYFVTFWATKEQVVTVIKKELDILNATKSAVIGALDNKLYFQVSGIKYTYTKSKDGDYVFSNLSIQKRRRKNGYENKYKVVLPNFLWDVLELKHIIDDGHHLVHESIQDTMTRILRGNSLKSLKRSDNIYQRKTIKD